MSLIAICTIGDVAYLPKIRCMFNSYSEYNKGVSYALIPFIDHNEIETFISLNEKNIGINDISWRISNYNTTEYCTSIKPNLLRTLLRYHNKLCYFDPDIMFYDSIEPIWDYLDEYDVVLTPHLLEECDSKLENHILKCGTFNLGFIGVRKSDYVLKFLNWWEERLFRNCFFKPNEGIFVDQKWIDLLPSMPLKIKILKDPGYNVAYWNIKNRKIKYLNGSWIVNDENKLRFFHFSGYEIEKRGQISKFDPSLKIQDENLFPIFMDYDLKLYKQGYLNKKIKPPIGLNVSGYLTGKFGLGQCGRYLVKSIQNAKIPHTLQNIVVPDHDFSDNSIKNFSPPAYSINFFAMNADQTPCHQNIDNFYNISLWFWELEYFPVEWKSKAYYLDEIWTVSDFCQTCISNAIDTPTYKITQPIFVDDANTKLKKSDFGLPNCYTFCYVFDFCSAPDRKNPDGLISAFLKIFKNRKDVSLVIKMMNSHVFPDDYKRIIAMTSIEPNIFCIHECMDRSNVLGLINCCDCYVSLHRSEGFGLTIAEAMLLNKPVIATNYGGNTDFTKHDNAFLVNYNRIKTPNNSYWYAYDAVWADPDIDHAAELMEFVYQNQSQSQKIADKGNQFIQKYHNVEVCGDVLMQHLKRITHMNDINKELSLKPENQVNKINKKIDNKKLNNNNFDENFYLNRYPDVFNAIRSGHFRNGFHHFALYGQYEKRQFKRKP